MKSQDMYRKRKVNVKDLYIGMNTKKTYICRKKVKKTYV